MKRRDTLGVMLASLGLAGCWGNTYTWNQKLTVVVDTPDGEKSGSAVTQVTAKVGGQGLLSAAVVGYKVKGEATVVDLGNGKYLFALLSNGGNWLPTEYWAEMTFYKRFGDEYALLTGTEEKLNAFYPQLEKLRASERLPPDRYPLMVTFADVNEPKSVKEVKAGKLADVFGADYALKAVTLEMTDEAVALGQIAGVLPWAPTLAGSIGKDMKLPYEHILNQIYDGSFIRGGI